MTTPGIRKAIVGFGVMFFALSAVVAAFNVTPLYTLAAIVVAAAALYAVIVASGAIPTGRLLDPESRVVHLVGEAATSEGGKALFVEATKSLKIVAGWLGPGIFFNDAVFATCRRIIGEGGEVLIIVAEPERTREQIQARAKAPALWREFEGWLEEGLVSLRKTQVSEPPHFAIVDDTHVWDEDHHDPAKLGNSARVIFFDDRVRVHNRRFKRLQRQSVPF